MKDKDTLTLTVADVKRAAEKCGTAKEVLKEMFPKAFDVPADEWEDVTTLVAVLPAESGGPWFKVNGQVVFQMDAALEDGIIFIPLPEKYKIEKGKVWRKRQV